MNRNFPVMALAIAGVAAFSSNAQADKPAWAGNNKNQQHEERQKDHRDSDRSSHFNDSTRRIVGDYYGSQARRGKCPPGLAKKNNGCLPPGQARKWAMGQPLPADLRTYDLPRELLKRLPPPPPEHRYVQVAGDILMIAVGTSMVIDAIEDILR